VRCAPPDNAPTPAELEACRPFLTEELGLLRPRVLLALGHLAWSACLTQLAWPTPRPAFSHGATFAHRKRPLHLVGCYHVSRQNTQTGRLTEAMFDALLKTVVTLLDLRGPEHR